MSFESFNLNGNIVSGVKELGYTKPTPIQEQSIPPILMGRDIIGLAQTGTGKTAAFVLPVLHRLMNGKRGIVKALVVSPTRELAEQTHTAFASLGKYTNLHSTTIYGGVDASQQNRILQNGVEIIVACPGRLIDFLWQGIIDLSKLEILIIDEADRLFDMGFLPDIRNILNCIMNKRQTLLFSATMPPAIRQLVPEILDDPISIQIGTTRPANTVSHVFFPTTQQRKPALLKTLLQKTETDSVLVFTRTKHGTERIAGQLKRTGFCVEGLQGNMSQYERKIALDNFRSGQAKILVATDIAARGIDVSRISHVINYDMPDDVDSYIHRIGRTGRIGKTGTAFTLVTTEDNVMVHNLEKLLNRKIERRTLKDFDYSTFSIKPIIEQTQS